MKRKLKHVNVPVFLFLLVGSLAMIFPFAWMILSSFKTVSDVYAYPPKWIPSSWRFDNYVKVFQMIPFGKYYFNSIFTSAAQTALELLLAITAAYSLVALEFRARTSYTD
jgi:multiple sugar transport system permease protein